MTQSDYKVLIVHKTIDYNIGMRQWAAAESSVLAVFKTDEEADAAIERIVEQNKVYAALITEYQSRGLERREYIEAIKLY